MKSLSARYLVVLGSSLAFIACNTPPQPAAPESPEAVAAPETPAATEVDAEPKPLLHPMFSDHAVVQRGVPIRIWGWAKPSTRIKVSFGGAVGEAVAGDGGLWKVELPALDAGGPHSLVVEGPERIERKNIMVGEVWLCSGQSNMEWPVSLSNDADKEISGARDDGLRVLQVPKSPALEPKEYMDLAWQPAAPESIRGFSAVCYFFGRELRQKLEVPVGLVNSSWGGTPIRTWMSTEALLGYAPMREDMEQFRTSVAEMKSGTTSFEERMQKYWLKVDPGTRGEWQKAEAGDWQTMSLPGNWEGSALGAFDGIVWFQRVVDVPAELAGKPARLNLGPIDDRDTTFINGQEVGAGDKWSEPRVYQVPAGLLRAGKNLIAIRVLDTGGGGGLGGKPEQYALSVEGQKPISLTGDWRYRQTAALSEIARPPVRLADDPNQVTVLYNGMLSSLAPYRFRGALWYQGESDAWQPARYRELLPAMIADWRRTFDAPLSFYIVQLANFMQVQTAPAEQGSWAELREAQSSTASSVPNTGVVVTTDVGDAKDIHPRNKQEVGRRLAAWALAKDYGQKVVHSGPTMKGFEIDGNRVRITFDHVGSGLLVKKGGPLRGFAIAGEDGKFVWGDARIEGDTVVVTARTVKKPVAVRYNWANNPIGNLANKESLPADSFRTDVPR